MNYWMILKISLKALSRNKIRSALTMLGIIIGIAAVIAMVSLGQGAQRQIQEEIASLGDNIVWVRAGQPPFLGGPKCLRNDEQSESHGLRGHVERVSCGQGGQSQLQVDGPGGVWKPELEYPDRGI